MESCLITGEKLGRSIFSRNTSIRHADSVAAEDVNIRWDAEIKRSETTYGEAVRCVASNGNPVTRFG